MPDTSLVIHYATVTGNSETLARQAGDLAAGFEPKIRNLAETIPADLAQIAAARGPALFVVSTWGDGEPPADACDFWYALEKAGFDLTGLRYAVFGLGDHDYPQFNAFARLLDERLAALGATRVLVHSA